MKINRENFIYIEDSKVWMSLLLNGQELYDYWGNRYTFDSSRNEFKKSDYMGAFPYSRVEMKLNDFLMIGMYQKK